MGAIGLCKDYKNQNTVDSTGEIVLNSLSFQAVHGEDKRIRLIDSRSGEIKMNEYIGLVSVTESPTIGRSVGGEGFMTGVQLTRRLVLTCAHGVYNRKRQIFHRDIKFYPGLNGNRKFNKCIEVVDLVIHPYFKNKNNPEGIKYQQYDIALLKLKQPVEGFEYEIRIQTNIQTIIKSYIYGYPNDINRPQSNIFTQCGEQGYITTLGNKVIYQTNTQKGQSGSPIFIHKSNHFQIIGIHTGSLTKDNLNFGVALNQSCFRLLMEWEYFLLGACEIKYMKGEQKLQYLETSEISRPNSNCRSVFFSKY